MFFAFAVVYFASIALPSLLQGLFGYDALRSGLAMSPSGVSSMAAMVVAGILLGRQFDARWMIAAGLVVMAAGNYWMAQMNLQISFGQVIWPRMVLTLGLGLLFAPASVAAYKYIPVHLAGRRSDCSVCSAPKGAASAPRWPYDPGTASAIPLVPPGREPGSAKSPCSVVSGADPRVLPAVDRRPGPVAAVGGPVARQPPPAAGRVARLLRHLLGVRRPVGGARRSGTADEALGGREGRARLGALDRSENASMAFEDMPGRPNREGCLKGSQTLWDAHRR